MNRDLANTNILPFNKSHKALSLRGFDAQTSMVIRLLRKLKIGALRVDFPNGQYEIFGQDSQPVTLTLNSLNACRSIIRSGDIGFAQSYIDGDWETNDLTALIELFLQNRQVLESVIYGKWWGNLIYRFRHLFNRNSKAGSRKNIHAHYDIGNDFYKLWLDSSMTYSGAIFSPERTETLEEAQVAKYRRILEELQVKSGDRILEIGCGWGGFAELAAQEANVHLTGLTLSKEQLIFAENRLSDAGVAHQTKLLLQDYRDIHGDFDAIASIEMFEAVGEAYWPSYFDCIVRNLRSGGRACIQTIVINDELFERYRKGTDFIQQYIFPGGMLPSPPVFIKHANRHGLKVVNEFMFGQDYAQTLSIWRKSFQDKLDIIRQQGFDDQFLRTWDFYFAYCEAGFRAGSISLMQFTLEKE